MTSRVPTLAPRHLTITLLLTATVAVLAAGCGTADSKPLTDTTAAHASVDGIRATSYSSVDQLWHDSTLVVEATASKASVVALGRTGREIPFTETDVVVSKILGSKTSADVPSVIPVRQLGTKDIASEKGADLLVQGRRYLLFLSTDLSKPNSGWYITGAGAGAYVSEDGGYARLDSESPALPSRLSAEGVQDLAK
jgi:hypothetical protein